MNIQEALSKSNVITIKNKLWYLDIKKGVIKHKNELFLFFKNDDKEYTPTFLEVSTLLSSEWEIYDKEIIK